MDQGLTFEEQANYIEFLEDLVAKLGAELGQAPDHLSAEKSAIAVIRKLKDLRTNQRVG